MSEPIKCPFCGMTIMNIRNRGGVLPFAVECGKCQAMTKYFATEEEAIAAWNQRKPVERIIERLENEILENLSDCGDDWFASEQINKAIEIVKEEGGLND